MWEIRRAANKEAMEYLQNDAIEGESDHFNVDGSRGGLNVGLSNQRTLMRIDFRAYDWQSISPESEKYVPHVIRYHQFLAPLHIDAAEKMGFNTPTCLRSNPVSESQNCAETYFDSPRQRCIISQHRRGWEQTLDGVVDFFEAARHYRRTLINYFYDEDAFSSRQWFASDKGAINLDDLPGFAYQRTSLWVSVSRALPDLQLLILLNIALFLATFAIFVRREI